MITMTLEDLWAQAAADLGLDIDVPYSVRLPSGASVDARVHLRNFGGDNGMLVVSDYSIVSMLLDELASQGYGFSVLDDPLQSEVYDREVFIEMLTDWGWSGTSAERPSWIAV
jgi:hypothetical protein